MHVARSLNTLHRLLAVQSLVVLLVSINRLTPWTTGYVLSNEFLRWVDFNNMLPLPLLSTLAAWLVVRWLTPPAADGRAQLVLMLTFLTGVYLLAASYGNHEVTNYLHVRFCMADAPAGVPPALCRIVIFNDDEFSHWVFFAGFVLINTAQLLMQAVWPYGGRVTPRDTLWLIANALLIGLGIFANLGFEAIGLDLYVVLLLALLAGGLLWRRGRQPLFIYFTTAYVLGLVLTAIVKVVR